jgi:mono/diheme cytochrome c family protein
VRARSALSAAGLALALAAGAAACGTGGLAEGGDPSRGKELFVQNCGSCHTLADAGTKGAVGPNLDDAFGPSREQGFEESTIRDVVLGQIRTPVTTPSTGAPGMPANIVEGEDAESVADYVASVAGKPVAGAPPAPPAAEPPPAPPPAPPPGPPPAGPPPAVGGAALAQGKQVFTSAGCGSCHTLADAGATGTIGPDLDVTFGGGAKPPKDLVIERVTNGAPPMPSFKGQLSDEQIDAVATYVSSVAGQ